MDEKEKKLIEENGVALRTLTDRLDKVDGKVEKLDALDLDVVKRTAQQVAENQKALQAIEADKKANDERIADIESHLARSKDSKDENEFSEKERNEYEIWMRTGKPMSQETYTKAVRSRILSTSFGISDAKREELVNEIVTRDLSSVNPDSGYLMPTTLDSEVGKRLYKSSPVRMYASVATINGTSYIKTVRVSGGSVIWPGEFGTITKTTSPSYAEVEIPLELVATMPAIRQKTLDYSYLSMESEIAEVISDDFARGEATAFVTGDGNKKPKGITTYAAWTVNGTKTTNGTYEFGKLEQLTGTDSTNGYSTDDLIVLKHKFNTKYMPNLRIFSNTNTFVDMLTRKNSTTGEYAVNRDLYYNGGQMLLAGIPIVLFEDMPAIATGSLPIMMADLASAYKIVDGIGIRMERDAVTVKGLIQFYTTKYVGGGVVDFQAAKFLKMNTVA